MTSDKSRRDSVETKVVGNFKVVFADWGIPNPSLGPISTADRGLLELLLVFQRP